MPGVLPFVLWFSAIGCGLMAGICFVFSTFAPAALAKVPRSAGIATMQAINAVIQRSLFMPLFFGTTLSALGLAVTGVVRWHAPGSAAMLVGGVAYVLGMFACTVAANIPLNEALGRVDPHGAEAAPAWARYLRVWTRWNHVRTSSSAVACACFVAAIAARAAGPA